MPQMRLYKTEQGEYTLFIPQLDETYHSRDGAIAESLHVFIRHGLERFAEDRDLHILEVGMGTGLNVLLSALHARSGRIEYHTMEPFPVPIELVMELGYIEAIGHPAAQRTLLDIHGNIWDKRLMINDRFDLIKQQCKLEDMNLPEQYFDLVYLDAFAPRKQPELWSYSQLERLSRSMRSGGVLTTYSAAGQLKRDLLALGFALERPTGAHGKRQMTVAFKP